MLFTRIFFYSLLVGVFAGLACSAVQRWQVVPIIAAAEAFESAAVSPAAHHHPPGAPAHTHDDEAWQPQDGAERTLWTLVANVLGATGFALLVLPALAWWDHQRGGRPASPKSGLLWGAAGWLCLFVWPALGLSPELPGEDAAALAGRQGWWLLAAGCAVTGLALLVLGRGLVRWLGLPLLALPFVVGAPHAAGPAFAGFSAEAAAQLAALKTQFFVATAFASAVQWLLIGALCGLIVARSLRPLLRAESDAGLPVAARRAV